VGCPIVWRMRRITLLLLTLACLPACAPVLIGAGAVAGAAAVSEGGISGTAEDAHIGALIRDAWFKYDTDTFAKLNLTVRRGEAVITGVVQDPQDRVEAVRRAWGVPGVKKVVNEIQVTDSEGARGFARDTWITTRLRTALAMDGEVQSFNYSIDTVQGTVYLMGYADSRAELDRATEIARTIPGVVQVVSYVRVRGTGV
jgi:osmotically-inducible protein OsmY